MNKVGQIRSAEGPLLLGAWLQLRDESPELVPIEELEGRNPATGEHVTIPAPHSAHVLAGNAVTGSFFWNNDVLLVMGEPTVRDLATRLATALGAHFVPATQAPPPPKHDPMADFAQRVNAARRSKG